MLMYRELPVEEEEAVHQIRISLTSCSVKSLGKVCAFLTEGLRKEMKVKGLLSFLPGFCEKENMC
uniref:Uncharacterized protein n=1 Tax=Salvator merianae TaxID=96440 RepID=A0A8D0KFC3_SALMN